LVKERIIQSIILSGTIVGRQKNDRERVRERERERELLSLSKLYRFVDSSDFETLSG